MLWLHLGMPKTGTTALQAYVRGNAGELAESGLRYMETGRRELDGTGRLTISHNRIAFHINQTDAPMDAYREAMSREYEAHGSNACLVSSEMFYSADLTRLAQIFADFPAHELRIVFYCRRYSDYFEADYKQRVKNGRYALGATRYVRDRVQSIESNTESFTYSGAVSRIRSAFPGVQILPLMYDRHRMVNSNVVDDFMSRVGLDVRSDPQTQTASNQSLSRAGSEAFGIVTRAIGRKQSRQLRRQAVTDPVMIRRHDVLEPDERVWLDNFLGKADVGFHKEFFADQDQLFPPVELSDEAQSFRRDTPEEYEALQRASEIVFRMALEG